MSIASPLSEREPAEEMRLHALEKLGMFGTGPEERFDRISALAQGLFGVRFATITLVGRDQQWYLSTQGIALTTVPRDESFCEVTVREREIVVVEDMSRDERFADSAFVTGPPHIRFYAGCPLEATDGQVVGTLCLMDDRPRAFPPTDRNALRELGLWVQNELNRSAELDRAAEVQRGLLPRRDRLDVPGYELAAACLPSRAVGGDLVDYYFAPDGDVVITLGDVMGKGIGAAIMMATVRAAMRAAGRLNGPAEAVRQAAATLDEDLQKTRTIVTLCHIRITPGTGEMTVADAGHGLCVVIRDGEILSPPGAGGLPLGVVPDDRWPESSGRLLTGDTVVAFSDGLLDLFGSIEDAFADVLRVVSASPDAYSVVEYFETLARRHPVSDDVTLFVLRKIGLTGG